MPKKIALAVALLIALGIAVVLILAAFKPPGFSVQRSVVVAAPPEKVFAVLNDFRRWPEWSPWEKLDPAMKRTLGGAERGKGATYAWQGNAKAGAGRMEIVESVPAKTVGIQLDFIEPIEGRNTTVFTLTPQAGGGTQVNWEMRGLSPFVSKLMQVFVSMDRMIGNDFEEGLANLKRVVER